MVSEPVRRPTRRSACPIATALDLLGDRWSLLIVRDLMFGGPSRFADFTAADERIATNVLADRLARLECASIIDRIPDPADGRRVIYALTDKGMDLAPLLVEMVIWAADHEETGAPPAMVRRMKRHRSAFLDELRHQWREHRRSLSGQGSLEPRSPRGKRSRLTAR